MNATDAAALEMAIRLATAQCTDSEIVSALVCRLKFKREAAAIFTRALGESLVDHRQNGRASLREHLWAMSRETDPRTGRTTATAVKVAESLAVQHCGWTREGMADTAQRAVEKVERQHYNGLRVAR